MSITSKTRKTLWGKSGNRCAICQTQLVLEKDPFNVTLNLGEECHIISRQENGPRFQKLENFDYDSPENLILLCCNHHTTVDEQTQKYPKELLESIKSNHEDWVKNTLGKPGIENQKELSKQESLLAFIMNKNQKLSSMKYSEEGLYSYESLDIALKEIEKIKLRIKDFINQADSSASEFNIVVRDNKEHICDVRFNGYTLLTQFYQAYGNMALHSYLLFGIVKGYFDSNGRADVFNPATVEEIIRLQILCDNSGNIIWRDQENDKKIYTSDEITDIWLDRFFKKILK